MTQSMKIFKNRFKNKKILKEKQIIVNKINMMNNQY
jgi:hypothetical protein